MKLLSNQARDPTVSREERLRQLQQEYEYELNRLEGAGRRAADAIRTDLKIGGWVKQYPWQSAMLLMFGGVLAGQFIQYRRNQR